MARPARTRLLLLVCSLVLGAAMIAPGVASGAATITQSGTELKISDTSGGPFDLTITVSPDGTYFAIISSGGIADPLPPGCTRISADHVRCQTMGVGLIQIVGGDAADRLTITDQSFSGALPEIEIAAHLFGGDDSASIVIAGKVQGTVCDMGDGDDYCISGREVPTTCTMGKGNDICIGGAKRDSCDMGAGRDVCSTGAERDSCSAGKGRDVCRMGPDPDVCRLGGGPDTCIGGEGLDFCAGNGGRDTCRTCERTRGAEFPPMPPSRQMPPSPH